MVAPVSNANVEIMADLEASWGVPKATIEGKKFGYTEEGFDPGQNLLPNEELDGTRRPKPRVPGDRDNKWSLTHYASLQTLPFFWTWILGKRASSGGGPYTHINTREDDSCILPSAIVQKKIPYCGVGVDPLFIRHLGARVGQATIEIKGAGYYSINCSGEFATHDESFTTTMDASPVDWVGAIKIHHGMLTKALIEIDGVASAYARFSDLKIEVTNNLVTNDRGVGDGGAYSSLQPMLMGVSVSGNLRVTSPGDLGITGDSSVPHSLSFMWDFDGTYSHKIELGTLQFPIKRPMAKGQGILSIPFQSFGFEDPTATIPSACRVTTINALAAAGAYD